MINRLEWYQRIVIAVITIGQSFCACYRYAHNVPTLVERRAPARSVNYRDANPNSSDPRDHLESNSNSGSHSNVISWAKVRPTDYRKLIPVPDF